MEWRHIQAARRLLASEQGALVRDWGGRVPIALAYPNSYAVGMSSLAVHGLYRWLNEMPGIVCERAFASLGRRPTPQAPLITLESQRPVADMAAIAFSVSFEMDYFNVVDMLRRANIPLRAEERERPDPLIILGGPAVSANPMPLSLLADAIVIGEIEPLLEPLWQCLQETWSLDRGAVLSDLARIPGIYVPLVNQDHVIQRQLLADLDTYPLHSALVAPKSQFGDMHLIEISRGCGRGCRFCLAGYWYRPPRERSLESILEQARAGMLWRDKIGLVGSAVSDYSAIDELARALLAMGAGISVSSLRVSPLSPTVVSALAQSGARSLTLAPEAGSERLRKSINKGLSYDDIMRATELAAAHPFQSLKLYFMIGLPGEVDQDIDELLALVREVKRRFPRQVVANITPFVPKAHTPYQRVAMAPEELLDGRLARIREGCQEANVQVRGESSAAAHVQAVLSRGDALIGEALLNMRPASPRHWDRALHSVGLSADLYLRERSITERLPWAMIDSLIRPSHLRGERRRARRALEMQPGQAGQGAPCEIRTGSDR